MKVKSAIGEVLMAPVWAVAVVHDVLSGQRRRRKAKAKAKAPLAHAPKKRSR